MEESENQSRPQLAGLAGQMNGFNQATSDDSFARKPGDLRHWSHAVRPLIERIEDGIDQQR
jgi:hypothetical protein